jgi:DNA-binding NarL/FixJ family response regulator
MTTIGRPRAAEIAQRVPGGYELDGLFYSYEEWERQERRRETYRRSKARARTHGNWDRPTPLMQSIAILYHFGCSSGDIADRLRTGTATVKMYLTSLTRYWDAGSWSDAATLEWHAMQGEAA